MADESPKILGIDGAKALGWAYGPAGQPPRSGSIQCAGSEASRGAVFAGGGRWITSFLTHNPVDILAIEAPLAASTVDGQTNIKTTSILFGLPAVLEFMAYQFGVFRQERVVLASVRKHFIGKGNLKGEVAKPMVWRKCLALGWISAADEDLSHDRSDALAVWSFAEATFAPKLTQPVDDLFVKAAQRKRDAEAKAGAGQASFMSREPF